jgi:predicted N-acetyltransferase YhbS
MTQDTHDAIRDLGDGLILRRGRAKDAAAIERHNAWHLRDDDATDPDARIAAWTRDLAAKPHPTFSPDLFTIVEDTRNGEIASCMCLIPLTWTYDGVPFAVGRPEMVSTRPEYQNRGLVRAQFALVHEMAAERGAKLMAITGIPYFYRQFGYEMCVALWTGRQGRASAVPKLGDGATERYSFRAATHSDIPTLAELCDRGAQRGALACRRDEATWRYELTGRDPGNLHRREFRLIENADGETVGFIAHEFGLGGHGGDAILLHDFELRDGISWAAVTPSVFRYLRALGDASQAAKVGSRFERIMCILGPEHPAYLIAGGFLAEPVWPYAWYVRVPDWCDFLTTIAPALERRLAKSPLVGHSGDLKISTYRRGVRLVFETGRISVVEPWQPTQREWGHAKFPDLTFLQLLFGHRSVEELEHAFADVGVRDDESRGLLRALFPKRPSCIWGLG